MINSKLNLISLQEAMDLLGISRATIDRWRKDKGLPHIKIGKEVWIDKPQLLQWIQLHSVAGSPSDFGGGEHTITIGYQSGAALLWSPLIIKQLGLFEEELELLLPRNKPVVRWINAPNGMELIEKLVAGQVNIASVGDYPIIASRTLSQMLPGFQPQVLAFDGKTRSGGGISLVVPAASGIKYAEQLTVASISIVGSSSSSYRLKEWFGPLERERQWEPIVHRGMGDCLNGIVEGTVGASILWEPYLSWVQTIGAGKALFSEGAGGDYLTGLVADGNWVRNNEAVVVAYLKAHLRAHAFIRQQPAEASRLIHEASGFPINLVSNVLSQIHWDASFYSRDLQTLGRALYEQSSDWLAAHKRDTGGLEFRKQYLQEAAEALKLPTIPDTALPGEWSRELLY